MMTYTRLRVGTKPFRSKPPRTNAPCSEPSLKGNNVLSDPGFETHIAFTGGGALGDEVPDFGAGFPPLYWQDDSLAPPNSRWIADKNLDAPDTKQRFQVVTTSPDAGTYHIRSDSEITLFSNSNAAPGDALYPIEFLWCDNPAYDWGWVSKIEPGDYVRNKCRAKASSTTGALNVWLGLTSYDEDGVFVDDFSAPTPLTTSYADYEVSGFVTSGAKYLQVYYSWSSDDLLSVPAGITADIDATAVKIADSGVILGSGNELTIASGVITVTTGFHTIDTEGDAATDDLDTISGGVVGQLLVIRSADSARDVTLKDSS